MHILSRTKHTAGCDSVNSVCPDASDILRLHQHKAILYLIVLFVLKGNVHRALTPNMDPIQ